MARTYARVLTNIWENDDFRTLSADAKLLYLHLISRRDLSSAGHCIIRERQWATQALEGDTQRAATALSELETDRYVIIDDDSGELLIRTFIRHDGGYRNPKHRRGIESAIAAIDSRALRNIAHESLSSALAGPTDGYPQDEPDVRSEPDETPGEPQSDCQSDCQSNSNPILPEAVILNPESVTRPSHLPCNSRGPDHDQDDEAKFIDQTIEHIASLRLQERRVAPGAIVAYKRTTITSLANARTILETEHHRLPTLTPDRLAAHYDARTDLHPTSERIAQ